MKIRRILAVVLMLAICLALTAGCGKGGSQNDPAPSGDKESGDSSVPGGNSGEKNDSKKDDGKKDDGKKDDPAPSGKDDKKDEKKEDEGKKDDAASGSDAPTVIVIPSATPGNADTEYEVDPEPFSDTAGLVTEIGGGVISYKVLESKSGEPIGDYSLFDPSDYKATDRTAELQYDEETPFYTRQDGKWYIASSDDLETGDTILIVLVEKTGELEGVIIFSK